MRSLIVVIAISGCAGAEQGVQEQAAALATAFQDGVAPTSSYAGTRDTMLEQDDPSARHGGDKKLSISGDTPGGSGRDDAALLQWDVTAIPRTATVRAATISVTVTDKADQTYGVFEVVRGWDEATATWNRASSGTSWQVAGAQGVLDRGAQLGAIRAASTGRFTIALTAAGVAAVQRWVADPATNHGVVLASASNDNRLEISSREDSKASRPRLEVTWDTGGGLDPTPGSYQETCDGSGAIALDFTHFLDLSDEDQALRVYTRATRGGPIQQLDLSAALGMATDDEADLEDAARVGDRLYAITSHGRDKDGQLQPTRYRFFAADLAGTAPALRVTVAGASQRLVTDLLVAANWDHPDAAVIAQLAAATRLDVASDPDLAPEVHGLNLEGLAADPTPGNPERLVLGLRNPKAGGLAILVTLLNPGAVIAGAPARFGEVIRLDLGGLGVRGLAWSDALGKLVILAGPEADVGPVRLYTWSGDPLAAPVVVQDVVAPALAAAEAIVTYPGTKDVQILFDQGGQLVGGKACKKLATSAQAFTDTIVHLD